MEQISLFPLEEKIGRALETIKLFEKTALRMNEEGYYLAFSGGKDSQVIYQLARMAGVKFTAHYHITTVDPPELVRFIRKEYPEVRMERPKMSMWQLIVKKGFPPTRKVRYCCSELKERGGEGRFVITGVRWAESKKRCKRGLAEVTGKKSADVILLNNDNDEKRRLIEDCQIKGKRVLSLIGRIQKYGISYTSTSTGIVNCMMMDFPDWGVLAVRWYLSGNVKGSLRVILSLRRYTSGRLTGC